MHAPNQIVQSKMTVLRIAGFSHVQLLDYMYSDRPQLRHSMHKDQHYTHNKLYSKWFTEAFIP